MRRSPWVAVVVIGHLALLAWLWQASPRHAGDALAWVQAPAAASVLMVRLPLLAEALVQPAAAPGQRTAPMQRKRAPTPIAAKAPRPPTAPVVVPATSETPTGSDSASATAKTAVAPPAASPPEVAAAPIEAPLTQAHADHAACPQVPYPPALRERGIEGVVRLRVLVDAQGQPAQVRVAVASGWRLFDDTALAQVRSRCRFVPARRGGEAIESWVDFPVRFALNG